MDQKEYNSYCFTGMLLNKEKNHGESVYLRQPRRGEWLELTWQETMHAARKLVTFLKQQGCQPGDKIALLSKNCAEWFITDFAITLAGMVSVPLYATQHPDSIRYVLDHSDSKLLFFGKLDNAEFLATGIPDDFTTIDFPDYDNPVPCKLHWLDIMKTCEPDQSQHIPKPDDIFSIVYTSGTTGLPKGVVLTHGCVAETAKLFSQEIESFNLPNRNHYFSYLPLAHVAERLGIELGSCLPEVDCDISFAESLESFAHNLQEVSPTLFFGVPRIWVLFQMKILEKLPQKKMDILLKIPLIKNLIKKKIQKALGLHNCAFNVSGAAPIPRSTLEFFTKLGIQIHEGYGMSENFAYTTLATHDNYKMGSVGKARPGVELKIAPENNELLARSPATMSGYYKDPDKTKKALTEDGFLRTGDIATIDDNGFVSITGRVKEKFKTQKGEYVIPVPIEHRFAANNNIDQVCLIGANLPHTVLLVNLSEGGQQKQKGFVEEKLLHDFNRINPNLTNWEKLSHIIIVNEPWTVENQMMTPTQKIKRNTVEEHYNGLVNTAIERENPVLWENDLR